MSNQQHGNTREPADETAQHGATQPGTPQPGTPQPTAPDGVGAAAPGSVFGGSPSPAAPGWGQAQDPVAGGWGAPGTAENRTTAPRSKNRKLGLAVAAGALVLAVGAGAGALVLTSNPAVAEGSTVAGGLAGPGSQGTGQGAGQGGGQGGTVAGGAPERGGMGGFAPGGTGSLVAALHGEYVVLQDGAYVTQYEQTGTVTDVTSTAVTVESSDGFTRSYLLGSDVVVGSQQAMRQQGGGAAASQLSTADIAAGGTVRVVAVADGSDYAAVSVTVTTATAGQAN